MIVNQISCNNIAIPKNTLKEKSSQNRLNSFLKKIQPNQNTGPYVINNQITSNITTAKYILTDTAEVNKINNLFMNNYADNLTYDLLTTISNTEETLENKMKAAKQVSEITQELFVGNDFAANVVGYVKCIENKEDNVEIFQIQQSTTAQSFLVIGRDPNSRPDDFTTWGPNAVICDISSRTYYLASDILQKSFDSKTQKIQLLMPQHVTN